MKERDRLIGLYREMHDQDPTHFPGRSLIPMAHHVATLIRKTGSRSLLDYGCGQGTQYSVDQVHLWFGAMPYLYDPGVTRFATKPSAGSKFDGVICSDVLEHIPQDAVRETLDEIFGYAEKFAFFSICCRLAKRTLPDGTNTHVTIKPPEWWGHMLKHYRTLYPGVIVKWEITP